MKSVLLAIVVLATSTTVHADDKGCRIVSGISSLFKRSSGPPAKQYYRAQDGSLRELIPYSEALRRSEDADRL